MAKRKKARSNNITGANTVAGAYRRVASNRNKKGSAYKPVNELERKIQRAVIRAHTEGKGTHLGTRKHLLGESNIKLDARYPHALAPGYRMSKTGKLYYENRKNRAD